MNLCFDTLLGEKDRAVEGLNRELKVLAARLRDETGALAKERDGLVYETKRLEERLDREGKLREEAEKIRLEGETLLLQKQRDIAELKTERDSALESSRLSLAAVERLKQDVEAVTREKDEFVKLSKNQEQKIGGLEKELTRVNESWKIEEKSMRVKLVNVEDKLGLATQRVEEMAREISSLLEEKKDIEKIVEKLTKDNEGVRKSLNAAWKELEDKQREVDEAVRAKGEIEAVKVDLESEIVGLRGKVNELKESCVKFEEGNKQLLSEVESYRSAVEEGRVEKENMRKMFDEEKKKMEKLTKDNDDVSKRLNVALKDLEGKQHEVDEAVRVKGEIEKVKVDLESEIVVLREKINELKESCMKFEEENKQLLSEVKSGRSAVEEGRVEKENMKKVFDEEKNKVKKLELLIAELQEMGVKRDADLGQVRSERDKVVENEKKLEGQLSVLRKENDALQSKLLEARKEVENLSAKIEVWCNNWNKALLLLKNTAAVVSQQEVREEEVVWNDINVEKMKERAVEEVERIKKAFESKEEMVDEMKQKLVSMNKSVEGAHKSKNMWTVISSATTIFAAVLAAYVARGR